MVETITYNGVKFRRYPNSKHRTDRVYFTPGVADKKKGVKRLHEEIWITHNGPIPEGFHIHHKDENPLNNDPDNLEALSCKDHMSRHPRRVTPELVTHLEQIRVKASEWHRSPEGREWHRQHAQTSLRNVEKVGHSCEQCGTGFEAEPRTGRSRPRFCSNPCKSAWRRDAGLDNTERQCVICNATFTVNRYAKKRTCGKSCAGQLLSRTKTGLTTSNP